MSITHLKELKKWLAEQGIQAKRSLSQNFLVDQNVVKKITSFLPSPPPSLIIEIGTGPGALTESLLDYKIPILAIETDRRFAEQLPRLIQNKKTELHVYHQDVMEFPLEEKCKPFLKDEEKAIVYGNLPYHLSSPILAKFLPKKQLFSHMMILVQEEFGRRILAKPGSKEYSSLSLFTQFYAKPIYQFTISPHCFYPRPKVHSCVILLELHTPPTVSSEKQFFHMVRTAFGQRRKMLRNSLSTICDPKKTEALLTSISLSPQSRPEQLSLQQMIELYEGLEL